MTQQDDGQVRLPRDTPLSDTPSGDRPSNGRASIGRRLVAVVTAPPTFGGAVIALVFGWWSFTPTLMPRTAVVQAAITALSVSLGYAIGTLAGRTVRYALDRLDRTIPANAWHAARITLGALGLVAVATGLVFWLRWQNDQRDLLGMDGLPATDVVLVVIVALLITALLMAVGRIVGAAVRKLNRWNNRHLSRYVAIALTAVMVFAISSYVLRDVAFARFTLWADSSFGSANQTTDEGVERPTSAAISGGPDSLVSWESLGRQGRGFAGGATTTADLEAFWGSDGEFVEPVRTYIGEFDGTTRERASQAVKELERAGGFERSVVVVATATGSGWIDPDAARALEMMYRGDSAIVTMQYSFLPSWISFITDLDAAAESGVELFNAVHDRWAQLPEGDRPKLIVFGLSLGSYGAEFAFAGADAQTSLANVEARTDGVLLVGPTNSNPMHRQFVAARDKASSVWNPEFAGGRDVQFITRDPDHPTPDEPATWPLVYVQHPSDPVTQWGFNWLWSGAAWNDRPRGFDVPDVGRWMPVVTWTQGVFDLMAGFSAPPGHGHDYRLDYVQGWSRVVPPEGWTTVDSERLEKFLQSE